MKKGWVTKKLGEVCETFNGIWKGSKPPFRNVGVIRSTNFTKECGFDSRDEKTVFIDVEEKKFLKRKLRCGDIVVERSGGGPNQPVGRVLYFNLKDGDYTISNFTSALRVKDNGELDSYYLYRALCALYFSGVTAKMQGNSINIINLHFDEYLNLDIPIPPLSEQKRIVKKIDAAFEKIDALKANAEKNLANAKELFQSALDEAMRPKKGWVEKRLGEVCKTTSGGTPIKSRPEYYERGTIPWLRSGEVCRKEITQSELYITKLGMENSSAKMMPRDTVLIAMYGATAAQAGILRFESTTNQAICGILPNDKFLPEFVYYYFKKIESQLAARAQGGAQPNISQEKIRETLIPMIPLTEQKLIVDMLNIATKSCENLQQNYTRQITDCVEMRQAILREAFEGRL